MKFLGDTGAGKVCVYQNTASRFLTFGVGIFLTPDWMRLACFGEPYHINF